MLTLLGIWNIEDAELFVTKYAAGIIKAREIDASAEDWDTFLRQFSLTCQGVFNPLCAFIGGFVAQEIVKAMTNKYTPLNQTMYYDSSELLPPITKETLTAEFVKGLGVAP